MGFSFANVDFGLPDFGDKYPDDARSVISMEVGDIPIATQHYEFVGLDGGFQHTLGFGLRPISAILVVRARTLAILHEIAWDMDTAKRSGGGDLVTTKGRTFQRTVLRSLREIEGGGDLIVAAGPTPAGWVRQKYALEFLVLSGQ